MLLKSCLLGSRHGLIEDSCNGFRVFLGHENVVGHQVGNGDELFFRYVVDGPSYLCDIAVRPDDNPTVVDDWLLGDAGFGVPYFYDDVLFHA